DLRERAAVALERAATDEFDLSFFDNSAMLELIPGERLVRLGMTLRVQRLTELEDKISEITDDADLDEDPESHFEKIATALTKLEDLKLDDEGVDLIDDARANIKRSIQQLEERKEERDKESDDDAD